MVPVRLYASAGGLAAGMSGLVTGYSHDFPAPPSAARDMRSDMSKRARVIINADDPALVSRVRAALQELGSLRQRLEKLVRELPEPG
mgnify:CR=1 FL=1